MYGVVIVKSVTPHTRPLRYLHDFAACTGTELVVKLVVDRGGERRDAAVGHGKIGPIGVHALEAAREPPVVARRRLVAIHAR